MFDTINKNPNKSQAQGKSDEPDLPKLEPIKAPHPSSVPSSVDPNSSVAPQAEKPASQKAPSPISAFPSEKYGQVEDIFAEIDKNKPKPTTTQTQEKTKTKKRSKMPIVIIVAIALLSVLGYLWYSMDGIISTQELKKYLTMIELGDIVGKDEDKKDEEKVIPKPENIDTDLDGLLDEKELELGTDVNLSDTDGDQLSDYDEVSIHNTDPLIADTDSDGFSDSEELNNNNTHPINSDSDNDELLDGEEVNTHNTDPSIADTDSDELLDGEEVNTYNTDPLINDTDGDTYLDGVEVKAGYNPLGEGKLIVQEEAI